MFLKAHFVNATNKRGFLPANHSIATKPPFSIENRHKYRMKTWNHRITTAKTERRGPNLHARTLTLIWCGKLTPLLSPPRAKHAGNRYRARSLRMRRLPPMRARHARGGDLYNRRAEKSSYNASLEMFVMRVFLTRWKCPDRWTPHWTSWFFENNRTKLS